MLNKSEELLNKSEELLNKSEELLNKSEELLNKSEDVLNKSEELLNKSEVLLNKSEVLLNKSEVLLNKSEVLLIKKEGNAHTCDIMFNKKCDGGFCTNKNFKKNYLCIVRNYLGIDYGERRVGIAFASELTRIAFPRETIDTKQKDLWAELQRIARENKVTDFVLGFPVHPEGHPDSKHKVVEVFAKELGGKFPNIPVHLQDESYSTQSAVSAMGAAKKKCKTDKARIDKAAAAVILQRFLDGDFK